MGGFALSPLFLTCLALLDTCPRGWSWDGVLGLIQGAAVSFCKAF